MLIQSFKTQDQPIQGYREDGANCSVMSAGNIPILGSFLFLTGCATTVDTKVTHPPSNLHAANVRNIAVLPIENDESGYFRQELETALTEPRIDNKPYFTVVSRVELDQVLAQRKLNRAASFDEEAAAGVAKLAGVKGIYLGRIDAPRANTKSFTETRVKCLDWDGWKCEDFGEYTVDCSSISAESTFTPKLVSSETAEVLYSRSFPLSADDRVCSDDGRPLKDAQTLVGEALSIALLELKRDVAPWEENVTITMMDDTEGLPATAILRFDGALAFMDEGRADRACEIWRGMEAQGPSSVSQHVSLLHNLAVCSEVEGDITRALAYCQMADRQLFEPNEQVNQCLARMQEQVAQAGTLNKLGCSPVVDSGQVYEVQIKLAELGFDAGEPDGSLSAQTRDAIAQFQRHKGLPADRNLTTCTLRAIRATSLSDPLPAS